MAKAKNKEVETSERLKHARDFEQLNAHKNALIPSKYDDVYSTDFYSDEMWDFLNKQQSKQPIDAITNVHNRIKKLSRKQLENECLMLARVSMASTFAYISRQIAERADMVDTGKLSKQLSKIKTGTQFRTDQKDKATFQRLYQENDTSINNIAELKNLDWFKRTEFCDVYPDRTLKKWRSGIDNRPLKLGRTPKNAKIK